MSTHPYQTIVIQSRDCQHHDDTGSNFSFLMQDTIYAHRNSTIALTSLLIPHSWYSCRAPYTTFQMTENGVTFTCTLPEGNYNVSEMDVMIGIAMTDASPSYVYSASTSLTTGRLTISSVSVGLNCIISFSDSPLNAHMMLGAVRGASYSINTVITSVTLPKFVSYSGVNADYVTIKCPQIEPSFITSQTGTRQSILFSYPMIGMSGDIESVSPDSLQLSTISRPFSRLDFQILDMQGLPFQLNGAHCVLSLQLFCPFSQLLIA